MAGELLFLTAAGHVTLLHSVLGLARIELMALILKVLAPDSILARDRLARFPAASITNTGGNGSPREGRGELRGHCALIVSPQFLVAARKGLPVPFACSETNELGEELVGSYICIKFIYSIGSNPTITTAPVKQRPIYKGQADGLSRGSVRLQT